MTSGYYSANKKIYNLNKSYGSLMQRDGHITMRATISWDKNNNIKMLSGDFYVYEENDQCDIPQPFTDVTHKLTGFGL
jgi:hypothetical protein